MNKIMNTRIFQFLKVVFPLILLILAVIEIMKFTVDINVDLLHHAVSQIHIVKLAIALLVTMAPITPMFFYDSTIVKLLGITVPTKKLIKQSLVINSFSNLIGFAGLIGVLLRT
jgi:phosphatidylglycerol lysyltransferase